MSLPRRGGVLIVDKDFLSDREVDRPHLAVCLALFAQKHLMDSGWKSVDRARRDVRRAVGEVRTLSIQIDVRLIQFRIRQEIDADLWRYDSRTGGQMAVSRDCCRTEAQ